MPLFSQSTTSGIPGAGTVRDLATPGYSAFRSSLFAAASAFLGFERLSLVEYIRELLPIRFRLKSLQTIRELRIKSDQDARMILFNALDDALCRGFWSGSRHAIETLQRFGSARRVGKPGAKTRVARNVGDHAAGMDQRKPDRAPRCFELVPQALGKPAYREFCRRIGSLARRRDDAEDTRTFTMWASRCCSR